MATVSLVYMLVSVVLASVHLGVNARCTTNNGELFFCDFGKDLKLLFNPYI